MTKTDLARELLFHIRLGEDSSIEFNQVVCEGTRIVGPHKDKMALEIAAFANSQGGRIVLGVDDKTREVLGIADEHVARVEEWVVTLSQQAINPPVPLHTRLLQLPDRAGVPKTVIYVEIPRSIMVHASNGRYYQRVGSTKQEMKPEVLMRLFQQRSQSRLIRFDETRVPGTTLQDIDRNLLKRFLRQ
ncbi:MAG TPA: transcriptional regulator, partial [Pseudomonas sp.]|nr:transcriptional regulator [Pseudomonas sp.]